MNPKDLPMDALLPESALPEGEGYDDPLAETGPSRPQRDFKKMMRKIPVTLTLEVGAARISLDQLMGIQADSVIELDTLAGEPLVIKVNGTPIGRAEVVVTGDNYGLKVVELSELDFDTLQS
jgi:flagellar motor switch protein FliN/FliY